jgi:pimeloyl-ACP methyl ester carboxylesterase
LFIAGEKDGVIAGATKDMLRASMKTAIPNLHDIILVPGVGHWIQQEAPDETNQAMIKFLEAL